MSLKTKATLKKKISQKEIKICIIGLGYVGLPNALDFARKGFSVLGIDIDKERVQKFNRGENYILGTDAKGDLKRLVAAGKLYARSDFSALGEMDIIVICVPTSLSKNLAPDLQHIKSSAREISRHLRSGQLICLESTVYPGTSEEIILPILESSGLKAEKDFYLCHAPERIDPGEGNYATKQSSRIVGGIGPESLEIGVFFYQQVTEKIFPVSEIRVAELAKVYENTFRAVNIALVNELMLLCDHMKINVWETLDAAYTKPFGIMPFYPGPGVGGHCIPVDPHYLEWKAREYGFFTRFISLAGEINRKMPHYVREIILRTLNGLGVVPSQAKILLLGMAYKKDINDTRESPAIALAELLLKDGMKICYHDPYIAEVKILSQKFVSVPFAEEVVSAVDLVVITTDHSVIDYQWLIEKAKRIVDTRNATKGLKDHERKVVLI
ncbi:MAG: nucleotide sugar dehydrogenase [Firmicutes bacterium]|nr:nucleotide sugar dehydrogenase [Bacillota bacterium]